MSNESAPKTNIDPGYETFDPSGANHALDPMTPVDSGYEDPRLSHWVESDPWVEAYGQEPIPTPNTPPAQHVHASPEDHPGDLYRRLHEGTEVGSDSPFESLAEHPHTPLQPYGEAGDQSYISPLDGPPYDPYTAPLRAPRSSFGARLAEAKRAEDEPYPYPTEEQDMEGFPFPPEGPLYSPPGDRERRAPFPLAPTRQDLETEANTKLHQRYEANRKTNKALKTIEKQEKKEKRKATRQRWANRNKATRSAVKVLSYTGRALSYTGKLLANTGSRLVGERPKHDIHPIKTPLKAPFKLVGMTRFAVKEKRKKRRGY